MPDGLTPSGTGWGTIAAYVVNQGWGIAPYTGFFICAELAGADSPDGAPGQYMHSGLYSGVGGRVMREVYNSNFREGWTRLKRSGDVVMAELHKRIEVVVPEFDVEGMHILEQDVFRTARPAAKLIDDKIRPHCERAARHRIRR